MFQFFVCVLYVYVFEMVMCVWNGNEMCMSFNVRLGLACYLWLAYLSKIFCPMFIILSCHIFSIFLCICVVHCFALLFVINILFLLFMFWLWFIIAFMFIIMHYCLLLSYCYHSLCFYSLLYHTVNILYYIRFIPLLFMLKITLLIFMFRIRLLHFVLNFFLCFWLVFSFCLWLDYLYYHTAYLKLFSSCNVWDEKMQKHPRFRVKWCHKCKNNCIRKMQFLISSH